MTTNHHDIAEALYQAPGEQIAELGDEIDDLRKLLGAQSEVSAALRDEVDRQLAYFVARTREIAPVVELLHEVAERAVPLVTDEDLDMPTSFIGQHQPAFAATLLRRLARARAAGELEKAAGLRDVVSTLARCSLIESVRERCIDGLRTDALEHGETPPGYQISALERLRDQALVPA